MGMHPSPTLSNSVLRSQRYIQRVKSRSMGDEILPVFKRLRNQSFPGVGQSVIFGKLTIDLAIIIWQKSVTRCR